MSFHSSLVAVNAWPADLATALSLGSASAQVYSGRKARDKADKRGEVWLERLPVGVSGDVQQVRAHPYKVHVRGGPGNLGGDKAGAAQVTDVEAQMRTIADRYHGANPSITGVSNVVSISAIEDVVDVDPSDASILDGTVLVTFYVKE